MAKEIDIFGFDKFEKALNRMKNKYPKEADAILMAAGQLMNKKTKSGTPVKSKKLKNSWRLKKVKLYRGGTVRVVRVESKAPHAHLIEIGHDIYTTGGRKTGRVTRYNSIGRRVMGIKQHGRTRAFKMLEYAVVEGTSRFKGDIEKMVEELCEEFEHD